MTTSNTPLKPCPNVLCGSDDTVVDFNGRHWCECAACGCKDLAFDDASEAIAHWNTRPQVKVKPKDVTVLLDNAFHAGWQSAMRKIFSETPPILTENEAFNKYDPKECPEYARILSALGEQ